MAININLTAKRLLMVSVAFKPATEVVEDLLLDGDGSQLLDGDGNAVFGWAEE